MTETSQRQIHFTGKFKELLLLFFPILITNFSTYVFLLVEKLFLARLSIQAMEAAVSASYACQIFQGAAVALAMMAQVFVGRWRAAQANHEIGPGVWQFIWFSLLSLFFTIPCGLLYGKFYFEGTSLADIVFPYYYAILSISFLFPLATSLSCFYLGQGRTHLVLWATLGMQIAKIFFSYLLIFGWGNIIPAWGLLGGPISTAIAQGGFCLLLLAVFLRKKNAVQFNAYDFRLRPKLFWECTYPGMLRAASRVLNLASWASIAQLMTIRGGDYLLVLSVGGTLSLALSFLADAICQTQMIVVSQILGSRHYHLLTKAFHSAIVLVGIMIFLFAIPFLVFPQASFHFFFPTIALSESMIRNVLFGVWSCSTFYAFGFVPISYILAYKDTKFSLFMGFLNWINGFLLMYVAIVIIGIKAENFWTVLTLMHATIALLFYWRMKRLEAMSLATGFS